MTETAIKHVLLPGIVRRVLEDGTLSLHQPAHGTTLHVEEASQPLVSAILSGFVTPKTLAQFFELEPGVPEELVLYFLRAGLLVSERERASLEHGFLRPVHAPIGVRCAFSDLVELAEPGAFGVVGVPVDMTALAGGGARLGPSEIRKATGAPLFTSEGDVLDHEFGRLYRDLAPRVFDLGDVDPEGGRMDHVGLRLQKVLREVLTCGMRPLVLGGDHGLSHYVLEVLCESVPRFGILHFDAHADLGPSRTVSHANVFEAALAHDSVASLTQIGLRMLERVSVHAEAVPCPKRTIVTAREAMRGEAMRALERLPTEIPYYLTFDVDCIDAAVVRETGTPSFGGLSVELATELVDFASRRFELLGADFVEVAGAQGPLNAAATVAAQLLQRVVMGPSPFEALPTDRYLFPA